MTENTTPPANFFNGNPKMIFVFGLVTGIALTSLAGDLFANTGLLAGAEDTVVVNTNNTAPSAAAASAKSLAAVTEDDHVRGDLEKAKVVLIEYSDYECPFCGRHHPTMQEVMDQYGDDVAWVYRHFPLTSIHPQAMPAALAAECANEQGKFWEYTDELFDNQAKLSSSFYSELAGDLGLNTSKFDDCVESEKYATRVKADIASGQAAGASGTPATFVNGTLVSGAVPASTFTSLIDAALK